jgi:transposase-like protein
MGVISSIRDVMKSLKHRRPSKIYCPRCASSNIHLFSNLDYWLVPKRYVCEDCGYNGPIVMELEKDEGQEKLS